MARFDDEKKQLKCSFCGKSQEQVKRLVAGPGVYICDECIELCQEIIDEALAAYQDESYQDYVGSIIEEEGYEPSDETLEEAAESLGINVVGLNGEDPEAGLSDGAIVAIIFGILILGFGGLVLYSRKK